MKPAREVHTVPAGPRWTNTLDGRVVTRHRTREAAIAAGAAIASQLGIGHTIDSGGSDTEAPDASAPPPGSRTIADPDGGGQLKDQQHTATADAHPHRSSRFQPIHSGERIMKRETQPRMSGTQAMIGALLAVLGGLAAANPGSALIMALAEAAPMLAQAVPVVLTACGAIIAAFSAPPKFGGQPKE